MAYTIIDAHAHLWLRQDTVVDGLPIRTLQNGRSMFMGEERQMLPPFMVDGVNSAEVFLSNMDYAQVGAAVITQEFIDGFQNDYLEEVARRYPDRFFVCGMCEFRKPGYLEEARQLIARGFKGIKIPAQRLLLKEGRVRLNCDEMMQMFRLMEQNGVLLSIDMADGDTQVGELEEVIAESVISAWSRLRAGPSKLNWLVILMSALSRVALRGSLMRSFILSEER